MNQYLDVKNSPELRFHCKIHWIPFSGTSRLSDKEIPVIVVAVSSYRGKNARNEAEYFNDKT